MISSINHLQKYNIVIILYPSGSSGEFLGHALTRSFENVAIPNYHWEKDSRMKFEDCFGRSFNGDDLPVSEATLLKRFNLYLESVDAKSTDALIGLAHPHGRAMNFIQKNLTDAWVIEIITSQPDSQKFRGLAAAEKIGPKNRNTHLYKDSGQIFGKHLKIEWKDLFMISTKQQYERMANFLGRNGNFSKFQQVLDDYLQRNQHLVNQL